jgi:hypothetical protein
VVRSVISSGVGRVEPRRLVRWTVGCSIAGDAYAWCEPRRFVRRRTGCRSRGCPGCPRSGGRVGQERTGRALTAAVVGDVVTADRESCCPATQNLGSVEVGVGRRRCAPARRCAFALAGSALAVPVWAFARSGTRGWLAGPASAAPVKIGVPAGAARIGQRPSPWTAGPRAQGRRIAVHPTGFGLRPRCRTGNGATPSSTVRRRGVAPGRC